MWNHFQNGGFQKNDFAVFLLEMTAITYSVVANVGWIVTLLPFFAFLAFRFRFSHIMFQVIDENRTVCTKEYTQTGNGLLSHNASTKSARNLTANQQTGRAVCKFHCWHKHQHVANKNITRSIVTKSLGFRPESILPRVNIEYPRRLGNFRLTWLETSYSEWRTAISILKICFFIFRY